MNLAGLTFGTGDRLVLNVGFPGLPVPTNPSALRRYYVDSTAGS